MEEIFKHYRSNGYTCIDITRSINYENYGKYIKSIINDPKTILYFERTTENEVVLQCR